MTFPKLFKFKYYMIQKRRHNLPNIAQILSQSRNEEEFFTNIENISQRDINAIERRTRKQSKNSNWFYYRKAVITGTLAHRIFHSIAKKEGRRERINAAISKTHSLQLYYPAIIHGRDNESNAIQASIKIMRSNHINLKVNERGLQLYKSLPILGASLDGWVTCDCCTEPRVLEVKCPFSIKDSSLSENGKNLAYLTENLELRENHQYYFQIQTYLGIYNCKKAYFGVWTAKDMHITEINFNEKLWKEIKNNLHEYYTKYYTKLYTKKIYSLE